MFGRHAKEREDVLDSLNLRIYHFWAKTSGGMSLLADIESDIRSAKVSAKTIRNEMIPKIPGIDSGTTGQRCKRVAAMLTRLAQEQED